MDKIDLKNVKIKVGDTEIKASNVTTNVQDDNAEAHVYEPMKLSSGVVTHRIYICQTPGIALWVSLHTVQTEWKTELNEREVRKAAIKSFKPNITDCRCSDCRYGRLVRKYNAKD
jgi:hypothetical protein